MFDSLADREKSQSSTKERIVLALMVLVISGVLFAALYFGVQTAS